MSRVLQIICYYVADAFSFVSQCLVILAMGTVVATITGSQNNVYAVILYTLVVAIAMLIINVGGWDIEKERMKAMLSKDNG